MCGGAISGEGGIGQMMDDNDMAHWHGPVYITTNYNERTKPFFSRQPLTHYCTHTYRLLFWDKDLSSGSIYEGEGSIPFLLLWRSMGEAKTVHRFHTTTSTYRLCPLLFVFPFVLPSPSKTLLFYLSSLIILGGGPIAILALQDEWGGGNLIIWLTGWFILGGGFGFTAQNQS